MRAFGDRATKKSDILRHLIRTLIDRSQKCPILLLTKSLPVT